MLEENRKNKIRVTNNIPNLYSFKDQNPWSRDVNLEEVAESEKSPEEDSIYINSKRNFKKLQDDDTRQRQKEYAKEIIDNLMFRLSSQEKQILELVATNLDYRDVGSLLKLPTPHIKQVMYRIRKKTERIIRFLRFRDIYS